MMQKLYGHVMTDKIKAIIKAIFGAILFSALQLYSQYVFYSFNLDMKTNEGFFNLCYAVFVSLLLYVYVLIIKKSDESLLIRSGKMIVPQCVFVVIIGLGMLAFVNLYFTFADFISSLVPKVEESVQEYHDTIGREDLFSETIPKWDHVLYLIAISIGIPLTEEIAFRGIVLGELRRSFGTPVAVVFSSIIFGAMHRQPVQVGYAVLCGIILGLVYCFCNSIWASFVVHAIFNFFGSGLTQFLDSGVIPGMNDSIHRSISSGVAYVEFAMFLPSIASLIFLGLIYNGKFSFKKEESVLVTNVETNVNENNE